MNPSESTAAALTALHITPQEDGKPVFAEPWQAQVFAMALALHQRGLFTWQEWADRLGGEIKAAQARGDPDLGDTYYDHWLATLENILVERSVLTAVGLLARRDAWDRAARATPHGEPIVLGRERENTAAAASGSRPSAVERPVPGVLRPWLAVPRIGRS